MKQFINTLCVILGFLSIGLGCIGIVLPVLPTTPFFLLAVFLFAKGSARFHSWFLGTRLYKKYLENFVTTRSMTLAAKIKVLAVVTVLLGIGIWFSPVFAKIILMVVALGHYVYFAFGIKTIKTEVPVIES
ncbi:MAG: YbaN family protein [Lachnospiraceae bacterium]